MNSPINTCIIGFGISGRTFHAPFLLSNPHYFWSSVVERSGNKAAAFHPGIVTYRSLEEALHNNNIDLYIITTPNETHFPFAQQIIQAGKHVVIEKPFTNTSKEALELIQLSKEKQVVLSVYHNRRYVSDFLTIKEVLRKKLLGDVVEFEGHFDRFRPEAKPNAWREESLPGSGILYDLGPHMIDQVLCLFGLPQSITADIRQQRPHARVDDYFEIQLDYGFTKAIIKASMLVKEPGPRYMIHGTQGSFIKYGEDPQEAALKSGQMPAGVGWIKEKPENYGLLHTELNGQTIKEKVESVPGSFGLFFDNLYETLVNLQPLREKPEHGYNTIRLIELARESNEKKCSIPCTDLLNVTY